jgi:hypothetical protein
MRNFLSTLITLLLATGFGVAQDARPFAPSSPATVSNNAQTSAKPVVTANENLVLKGAELKTEWINARNPFRFEVNESPAYAPERVEQMQVLGFSKMPDDSGVLQTYAFITKTTEGPRVQGSKPETKVTKDMYILRALPEKLDEQIVTTEEQTEESSIALGSEQLWFLGIVQTNGQTLAIFIPDNATYPIKEEDLRPFEIQDSLKDLQVRVTKAGEKISTEVNAPRVSSRPKNKSIPAKPDTVVPTPTTKPAATPPASTPKEKPTVQENPAKPPDKMLPRAEAVK